MLGQGVWGWGVCGGGMCWGGEGKAETEWWLILAYLTIMNFANANEAAALSWGSTYFVGLLHTVTMRGLMMDNKLFPAEKMVKQKLDEKRSSMPCYSRCIFLQPVTISWSQIVLMYSVSVSSAVAPAKPSSSSSASFPLSWVNKGENQTQLSIEEFYLLSFYLFKLINNW